jgi:hypothetical protein
MKYENARDILPESLLKEVQKYAEGKVIYIPKCTKTRGWGEASGYREKLNKRNSLICNRYSAGRSILEIAEEFYLSPETVKKIVYGNKVNLPEFSASITSADHYAKSGLGEEWVRTYLTTLGKDMPDSSEYFMSELARIPLRLISDSIKSDENMEINERGFHDVPLIVKYENNKFSVDYQQEYLRFLLNAKMNSHYAFVFARNEEYNHFQNNYGKHFQR